MMTMKRLIALNISAFQLQYLSLLASKLKYARIWGSGKHDGIMAKRDHILEDGDVIELHL